MRIPRTMWTDIELLENWRAGDSDAGDSLMRRHYESIRRFFDLKTPQVSEDLTQQTFLACVEGKERVRDASSFRAYLFGIARRQLLRHLRNKDRFNRMISFRSAQGPDTVLSPSGVVALREEQRLLLRAMDPLPVDFQIAIQLHYWEGLKTSEIAAVLEIPVSTVTTRLSRARDRIKNNAAELGTRSKVRDSLLGDLEGWARSLVNRDP